MATTEQIRLIITTELDKAVKDIDKLNKGLGKTDKESKSVTKSVGKMAVGFVAVGQGLRLLSSTLKSAVSNASNLAEQTTKFNKVFEEGAGVIDIANAAVQDLTDSYAVSTREARQYLASMQDLLKPLGILPADAAVLGEQIVKLSADMGSFNNLPTADIMADISSALVGMNRPMLKFGTVLTAATVKQEALNLGLFTGRGELSASARAQAAFNLILKSQADASGDISRTFNSFANVSKRVNARLEDMSATAGGELTPALAELGVAFLNASGEGGFLATSFNALIGLAAGVVRGITSIITSIQTGIDTAEKYNSVLGEQERVQSSLKGQLKIINAEIAKGNDTTFKDINLKKRQTFLLTELQKQESIVNDVKKESQKITKKGIQLQAKSATAAQAASKAKIDAAKKAKTERIRLEEEFLSFTDDKRQLAIDKEQRQFERLFTAFSDDKFKREELLRLHNENKTLINDEFDQLESDRMLNNFNTVLANTQTLFDGIVNIVNQAHKNQTLGLQNRQKKERALLIKEFDEKIALAKKEGKDTTQLEKEKKDALEELDAKFDAQKRALARKQAKLQKKIAIVAAIINTAQGVTKALADGGPFAGPILAGFIATLGGVQIDLIRQQPLPEAADGAFLPGTSSGTAITAGEGGKAEAILPLENEAAQEKIAEAIGGGGNTLIINIENLNGNEDLPEQFIEAIDRGLTQLDQDSNSTFSEIVRG